ncbi:unannotated protein [freshwater metagenome]|uniref:Unannotated protein n=1 Tax=freshwater metagenome TaxID=449393 RepID=A0A6J7URF0_9ZZZZ
MNYLSTKAFSSGKFRSKAFAVVVITRAHKQKPTRKCDCAAGTYALNVNSPLRLFTRPLRAFHHMTKPDMTSNVEFVDCAVEIPQNIGPVSNSFCFGPRFKAKAQRVHVGVGAHTWVAKKVPRAANVGATFENCVGLRRAHGVEVISSPNARNSRTYDEDIDVLA